MKQIDVLKLIRVVAYIVLFIALVFLGTSDDSNFGLCHIKENFGVLCPSCGITRASKAILSLDFTLAIEYNSYFTLVLLPTFLILLVDDIICILFRKRSLVDIILRKLKNNQHLALLFCNILILF